MIYPIILYGDPILNQVSAPITREYPNLTPLINDMYETMHKAGGIGLAAVQIGIPINLFIVEAHIEEENFHFREVFINPVMEEESGKLVNHSEGCLSIPGLTGMIERPEKIRISYYDQDWKKHTEEFDEYKARIIQHEYDHLIGKVYPDHLNNMWGMVLEQPLKMIAERKIPTHYLSK
jgi:peptide deformylase